MLNYVRMLAETVRTIGWANTVLHLTGKIFGRTLHTQVQTPLGTIECRLGAHADVAILREIILHNPYARLLDKFVPTLAPTRIYDVGAEIGAFSLFAAKRWPQANIFAFEPDPENFKLLQRNVGNIPTIAELN